MTHERRVSCLRRIGLILAANTAGGAIPAVLRSVFDTGHLQYFWREFGTGLAYSYPIGTLCFAVMPYVAPRLGRLPRGLRIPAVLVTFTAAAIVGSFAATLILAAFGVLPLSDYWLVFHFSVRVSIATTLVLGAVVSAFEALTERLEAATLELRTRQLAEERARQLATEARLSSLESRIHPHFLFNTLNSISALIREDPARAERTVERLAALLRYSLDSNAQRLVPLRHELRVLGDYLEIEKTRFGERLRYTIDVDGEIGELEVPPLALQTLVENSVKHALSANRQGAEIRVTARFGNNALLLEVSDDGPGFDAGDIKPGHGLENLQDRLAGLFEGQGRLEIARRDGRTLVSVMVPQRKVLV